MFLQSKSNNFVNKCLGSEKLYFFFAMEHQAVVFGTPYAYYCKIRHFCHDMKIHLIVTTNTCLIISLFKKNIENDPLGLIKHKLYIS